MDPRYFRKTGITLVAVALTGAALATSATAVRLTMADPTIVRRGRTPGIGAAPVRARARS